MDIAENPIEVCTTLSSPGDRSTLLEAPATPFSRYPFHPIKPSARRCTFIWPHGPVQPLGTAS